MLQVQRWNTARDGVVSPSRLRRRFEAQGLWVTERRLQPGAPYRSSEVGWDVLLIAVRGLVNATIGGQSVALAAGGALFVPQAPPPSRRRPTSPRRHTSPRSCVSTTQGTHGSVSNNGDGTLTYTPALNFTGNDSLDYTITDGRGGTNSTTVSLLVQDEAGSPYWTNLAVATEAFVRGGVNAASDPDEVATGYLMVKYNFPSLDNSRKAYFQFDLAGLIVDLATPAVFTLGFLNTFRQNIQLWALNQAYPDFTSAVTWNAAQANDTSNNSLLTGGPLSATAIGW